jgi:PTS system nitrogen regulatory IIA component
VSRSVNPCINGRSPGTLASRVLRWAALAAIDSRRSDSYIERQFNIRTTPLPDLLTLKQVADRLQLSERTIYRLLQRGELPGRKIGGQWRFRMSEIDAWLDTRGSRTHVADRRRLEEGEPPAPLSQALLPENALIRVASGPPRDVIREFVAAVTYPETMDGASLASRIYQREELSSTATVDGVAFLHTPRWEASPPIRSPLVAVGRLSHPVDFGAIDGTPTDLLFLLLAPDARTHLTLLAKAARLCRDPGLVSGLRAAQTPLEVIDLIRASERAVFRRNSETGS